MFSQQFLPTAIEEQKKRCYEAPSWAVRQLLRQPRWTLADMPTLLSPAAQDHLEPMAQISQAITRQRFGHTMQVFVPMYLSNLCYNRCTYCGFSVDNKYPRKTLSDTEMRQEMDHLRKRGFRHLLLLTGEAPDKVGVPYISKAVSLARTLFDSVGIEIQPLTETDYRTMITAGADSLTLYQETYHPEAYKTYHISGLKSRFQHRLDATDYGGRAGFYRLNIGALLGLYDWRWDALALAQHAHYLQRAYWQTKVMISMPRIRHTYGGFSSIYPVTDADLVQFICAFRMVFPDAGLSLSTREPAILRDALIPLGITQMSAESNTSPGGYTIGDEEPQFEISDHRPLEEVTAMLQKKGYDVVMKDWNREFIAL